MKFTHNKYLHLENTDGDKIYSINFYIYTLGYRDDDISVDLTINDDNSLDLEFDQQTLNMFNDPLINMSTKEMDELLEDIHSNLLSFPYINDVWELKYQPFLLKIPNG